jgi:phosphatidylinositol alpha-1,6-mannosyltransferase
MSRILLIAELFPPALGGAPNVLLDNCLFAARAGHAVRVLTAHAPGCEAHDAALGFRVRRSRLWYFLKNSRAWNSPFFNRAARTLRLVELFLRCLFARYDILWLGNIEQTSLFTVWLKKIRPLPFLVCIYGEEFQMYQRTPRSKAILDRVLRAADTITCLSDSWKQRLLCAGYDAGNIALLPVAVDTETFVPAADRAIPRDALGLRGYDPVLLTVARIVPRKGIDTLLGILPSLRRRYPNLGYLVVGEGEYRAELEKRAGQLGVSGAVRFTGPVTADALVNYYQAADVFVHPNREIPETGEVEGFGRVFIEAGACGIPVIGGDSGGTPDAIIEGKTGFLVNPTVPGEIEEAIRRLLDNPARREQMGRAGRTLAAERHSYPAVRDIFLRILESVSHRPLGK